jgi:hypothetical protein
VAPGAFGNYFEDTWIMNSRIVWNGTTANNPIAFNFGSVQSQVSRLGAYSDNLDATSPQGHTLSYNQALNINIFAQPTTNFNINTSTGLMTIPAGDTATQVPDNTAGNVGADKAFSGNILSSDGSFVEFDWMFDGVNTAVNNAPDVNDGSLSGAPGTLFNFLFTITDPEGDTTAFDPGFFAILGPMPAIAPIFNNLTGQFTWNSLGSALGTYIFQVRGRDLPGNLTDVGSLTINLTSVAPPPGTIPEPASILVHGGLLGSFVIGSILRRRR